jgi:ribosomal protein L7/L12
MNGLDLTKLTNLELSIVARYAVDIECVTPALALELAKRVALVDQAQLDEAQLDEARWKKFQVLAKDGTAKIPMIRAWREETGMSLAESKVCVEKAMTMAGKKV